MPVASEEQVEQLAWLIAVTCLAFAFSIWGWLNTPTYQNIKAEERCQVQGYLLQPNLYAPIPDDYKQGVIQKYGFTEADLDLESLLLNSGTAYNQKKGVMKH